MSRLMVAKSGATIVKEYDRISVKFITITPCFIHGYDQSQLEFRLASFKGVLRFWWRAIAWKIFNIKTIEQLYNKELEIFGGLNKNGGSDKNVGKSKIILTTEAINYRNYRYNNRYTNEQKYGLNYLMYGINNRDFQNSWQTISGKINIYFRDLESTEIKSIIAALSAMHYFGGIGAKSRKGFGSFHIEKTEFKRITLNNEDTGEINESSTIDELKHDIINFIQEYKQGNENQIRDIAYSRFSKYSKACLLKTDKNPINLLGSIGFELLKYRSYGFKGKLPDKKTISERNFKKDHDLMFKFLMSSNNKNNIKELPERIVFGLPHNYFFRNGGKVLIPSVSSNIKRRASPMFLKIVRVKDSYAAIGLILKSRFLEDRDILIEANQMKKLRIPLKLKWSVIDSFFDRFNCEELS